MPLREKREPFARGQRTMYYGGASYEKSQMLFVLRQLAQRTSICGFDRACGGPPLPPPPLGPVLSGSGPGGGMRRTAYDAAVGRVTCPGQTYAELV